MILSLSILGINFFFFKFRAMKLKSEAATDGVSDCVKNVSKKILRLWFLSRGFILFKNIKSADFHTNAVGSLKM